MWWPFKRRKTSEEDSAAAKVVKSLLALGGYSDLVIHEDGSICFIGRDGQRCYSYFKPVDAHDQLVENKCLQGDPAREVSWTELDPEELDKLVVESLCGSFSEIPGSNAKRFLRVPLESSIAELGLKLDIEGDAGTSSFIIGVSDLSKLGEIPPLAKRVYDSVLQEIP